jgi:hypothetical protein
LAWEQNVRSQLLNGTTANRFGNAQTREIAEPFSNSTDSRNTHGDGATEKSIKVEEPKETIPPTAGKTGTSLQNAPYPIS